MKTAIIYTDGGSRGNPGESAFAFVVLYEGSKASQKGYMGRATNNQAEYRALLEALRFAAKAGFNKVLVKADSELMVKQVKGLYYVKDSKLTVIYDKVIKLLPAFEEFAIMHIPREENKEADALVNEVLDAKARQKMSKRA